MDNNISLKVQLEQDKVLQNFLKAFEGDIEAANKFRNTLIKIVVNNPQLQKCTAQSIIKAALIAIDYKLSINPNFGYIYFVPYGDKAQCQVGWKGLFQLAMRTGKYITLRAVTIYEGMLEYYNFVTGEYRIGEKTSSTVKGFLAFFEMNNGFKHNIYMTKDEMIAYAKKYSKAYQYDLQTGKQNSVWSTDFNSMAEKTVLRQLISKFGYMSSEMERAMGFDQSGHHDNNFDDDIDEEEEELVL